ncbi:ABC transporter permease [Trueperella sp. LYQ143]|uniref:ABC transporter permease n=1 Tax=unclassified Trueperella TaxID=2630174 RepID=UPI00398373F1
MKLSRIVVLGMQTARSTPVTSGLMVIIAALLSMLTLVTIGRATAAEQELTEKIERPAARVLTVRDIANAGFINPLTLEAVSHLSSTEVVVGMSAPIDMRNGLLEGATPVPIWEVTKPEAVATLTAGRLPHAGEVILSESATHLQRISQPSGYITGAEDREYAVVGFFKAKPGFDIFDSGGIAGAGGEPVTGLIGLVKSTRQASSFQQDVLGILGSPARESVMVESPSGIRAAADAVTVDVARYNRSTILIAFALGGLLIAATVLADVLLHRRDLGRRRALGISRGDLTLLTIVRTITPAALGAFIASGGIVVYFLNRGVWLDVPLIVSNFVLCIGLTGIVSALPAAWSASRDPVAVLRTP